MLKALIYIIIINSAFGYMAYWAFPDARESFIVFSYYLFQFIVMCVFCFGLYKFFNMVNK